MWAYFSQTKPVFITVAVPTAIRKAAEISEDKETARKIEELIEHLNKAKANPKQPRRHRRKSSA